MNKKQATSLMGKKVRVIKILEKIRNHKIGSYKTEQLFNIVYKISNLEHSVYII